MTSSTRRMMTFVAVGLLCALALGVIVWRMSAPSSPVVVAEQASTEAKDSSTTRSTTSSQHTYTTTSTTPEPKTSQNSTLAAGGNAGIVNDPYLAPNAVFDRTEPAEPTAVYRPDNVSSLQQNLSLIHI